jgi:hypothetical protein
LTLSTDEEIADYLDKIDKESRAIKKEILELCWYMRGGLTYDEAMYMGTLERNIITDIVEEHLEVTKKTQMPFF